MDSFVIENETVFEYAEFLKRDAFLALNDARDGKEKEQSICPVCNRPDETTMVRRRRTAYVNDLENFSLSCNSCFEAEQEHWDEMWQEYYSSVL